ncbi:MAG: hypothetical protein ACREPV_01090 [Lysobacter sp.]
MWFRAHAGISTDNKFLRVMRTTGADGARVSGIWLALLDHASQARPRGTIDTFDVEGYALWSNLEPQDVQVVVDAFGPRATGGVGMHDGRFITKWHDRQSRDPTAAARQRKHRAKKAQADGETPTNPADCHDVTRDVTNGRDVTALDREIEQSSSSHTSTSSCSSTSSDTSRDDVRGRGMAAGEVWASLEQAGIPVGMFSRAKHVATIRSWVADGLTRKQFDEAVERATASRRASATPHLPLNVGFLNSVINNPLGTGKRSAAKSYEDGDEVSRRFAKG